MLLSFTHKLHVPSLFDVAAYASSPELIRNGPRADMPIIPYLKVLMIYARTGIASVIPGHDFVYSRLHEVYEPREVLDITVNNMRHLDVISSHLIIPDHVPDMDEDDNIDVQRLTDTMACVGALTYCTSDYYYKEMNAKQFAMARINEIASQIKSDEVRVLVMSTALDVCPPPDYRELLKFYGGRIEPNSIGYPALSAGNGDFEYVQQYLRQQDPVEAEMMLSCATASGDEAITQYLLDWLHKKHRMARLKTSSFHEWSWRYVMVYREHWNILDLCLNAGYLDLDDPEIWHSVRSVRMAAWLLDHGATSLGAVTACSAHECTLPVLKYLLEERHLPMPSDVIPSIIQHYPDLSVINYLIATGADIGAKNSSGNTAFHLAGLYARVCDMYDVFMSSTLLHLVLISTFATTEVTQCWLTYSSTVTLTMMMNKTMTCLTLTQ